MQLSHHHWCSLQTLFGSSNPRNVNCNVDDRVFVPSGSVQFISSEQSTARDVSSCCWIPQPVMDQLASSLRGRSTCPVPWNSMCIGSTQNSEPETASLRASEDRSRLIVVASLVDKIPNIAGLCRSCELLKVSELVVHDLSMLSTSNFQKISHGAETAIRITEIPREWLLTYLKVQRKRGFDVVAVEQTSSSLSLQQFKFSGQSVLLLGKVRYRTCHSAMIFVIKNCRDN